MRKTILTLAALGAAVALLAGSTAIRWILLPPAVKAQTNTFCAQNIACAVSAAWTFANINGVINVGNATYPATSAGLQAALNAIPSGASGGGIVLLPCNTTITGISSLTINNGTVIRGCTPAGTQVASGRSTLQMTADFALSSCQNITLDSLAIDFNQTNSGLHITSCTKITLNSVQLNQCGGTAKPCVLLDTNCTNSSCNTNNIYSSNLQMFGNNASSTFAQSGIKFLGSGPVNGGSFVTLNYFYNTQMRGQWQYCIDSELNSDTNKVIGLDCIMDGAVVASNTAVLAFNLNTPASDQDADGGYYYAATYTGANLTSSIRQGFATGNSVTSTFSPNSFVNVGGPSFPARNSLYMIGLPAISPFSSPFATVPGTLQGARFSVINGTALASGNIALSAGWGASATVSGIVGEDGAAGFNVNANGTTGANPSVTITWADGTWTNPPLCIPARTDGAAPTSAYWAYNMPGSATNGIFSFIGTPTSGNGYGLSFICVQKSP